MLTKKDYRGQERYFVSDPKPADSAFFDLSHQLSSDFPELRARLGKLVRRNAGKRLLDAATDPVKLKTLLKVPTKRAEKIIFSLGGFTLAGVDAAAALNDESIIPVNMCSELKLSDKIEVARNPFHLCVALQSSERHSKLKVLCIADALAKSRGLSPDYPNRLEAHAEFAINRVCQQTGSYWVPPTSVVTEAVKHMQKNWPSDVSTEPAVRTALQGTARIVCEQDGSVSTKKMAETEYRVAVWFTRLASRGPPAPKALVLAQHILDGGNTSSPCAEALLRLDQTQEMPSARRVSVRDMFPSRALEVPATHFKNQTRNRNGFPCVRSVEEQSFTVCASHALTWCDRDGKTHRVMSARESAILMGFGDQWRLPQGSRAAQKAVGNALCTAMSRSIMQAAMHLLAGTPVFSTPTPLTARGMTPQANTVPDLLKADEHSSEEVLDNRLRTIESLIRGLHEVGASAAPVV